MKTEEIIIDLGDAKIYITVTIDGQIKIQVDGGDGLAEMTTDQMKQLRDILTNADLE